MELVKLRCRLIDKLGKLIFMRDSSERRVSKMIVTYLFKKYNTFLNT